MRASKQSSAKRSEAVHTSRLGTCALGSQRNPSFVMASRGSAPRPTAQNAGATVAQLERTRNIFEGLQRAALRTGSASFLTGSARLGAFLAEQTGGAASALPPVYGSSSAYAEINAEFDANGDAMDYATEGKGVAVHPADADVNVDMDYPVEYPASEDCAGAETNADVYPLHQGDLYDKYDSEIGMGFENGTSTAADSAGSQSEVHADFNVEATFEGTAARVHDEVDYQVHAELEDATLADVDANCNGNGDGDEGAVNNGPSAEESEAFAMHTATFGTGTFDEHGVFYEADVSVRNEMEEPPDQSLDRLQQFDALEQPLEHLQDHSAAYPDTTGSEQAQAEAEAESPAENGVEERTFHAHASAPTAATSPATAHTTSATTAAATATAVVAAAAAAIPLVRSTQMSTQQQPTHHQSVQPHQQHQHQQQSQPASQAWVGTWNALKHVAIAAAFCAVLYVLVKLVVLQRKVCDLEARPLPPDDLTVRTLVAHTSQSKFEATIVSAVAEASNKWKALHDAHDASTRALVEERVLGVKQQVTNQFEAIARAQGTAHGRTQDQIRALEEQVASLQASVAGVTEALNARTFVHELHSDTVSEEEAEIEEVEEAAAETEEAEAELEAAVESEAEAEAEAEDEEEFNVEQGAESVSKSSAGNHDVKEAVTEDEDEAATEEDALQTMQTVVDQEEKKEEQKKEKEGVKDGVVSEALQSHASDQASSPARSLTPTGLAVSAKLKRVRALRVSRLDPRTKRAAKAVSVVVTQEKDAEFAIPSDGRRKPASQPRDALGSAEFVGVTGGVAGGASGAAVAELPVETNHVQQSRAKDSVRVRRKAALGGAAARPAPSTRAEKAM